MSKKMMLPIQPITKEQSYVLNVLRFISGQMVVFGHLLSFLNIRIPYFPLGTVIYIQNLGVILFFVLSGYLIVYTSLYKYVKNPSYNFMVFFIERTCRIFPAYLSALLFVVVVDVFAKHINPVHYNQYYGAAFNIHTLLGNVLMLQDYPVIRFFNLHHMFPYSILPFGSARPFWTIAVEWWLYLAYGYFILSICKLEIIEQGAKKAIAITRVASLGAIGKWLWFCFLALVPLYNVYGRGHLLTIDWVLGGLCFIFVGHRLFNKLDKKIYSLSLILFFCLALIICYYFFQDFYNIWITLSCVGIFYFALRYAYRHPFVVSSKMDVLFKNLAGYTFCLYLVHYSIIQLLIYLNIFSTFWLFIIAIFASNLVAFALYFCVDKRYVLLRTTILTWYNKFFTQKIR